MDRESNSTARGRRAFLQTASLASGAAAAGLAGAVASDAREARAETPAPAHGYRETAHVKRFYELAKKF
jgi:hypothetical protein